MATTNTTTTKYGIRITHGVVDADIQIAADAEGFAAAVRVDDGDIRDIEIHYVLKPAVLSVERQKHARHIRNGLSIPILGPFQENPE